jgi:hypothetical protein
MNKVLDFETTDFQPINKVDDRVFRVGKLSVGLVVPIENYDPSPVPTMHRHIERVQLAEELGFSAVWLTGQVSRTPLESRKARWTCFLNQPAEANRTTPGWHGVADGSSQSNLS